MTKQEAGRLGAKIKKEKHDPKTYRNLQSRAGAIGARVTWARYRLEPWGLSHYAMINRLTNEYKCLHH